MKIKIGLKNALGWLKTYRAWVILTLMGYAMILLGFSGAVKGDNLFIFVLSVICFVLSFVHLFSPILTSRRSKKLSEAFGKISNVNFRGYVESMKNLITWFPLVWKDRNFDHYFLFETIKFKLKIMAKNFKEEDTFIDTRRHSEQMELCVRLIDKIQKETYLMEHIELMEAKYGKMQYTIGGNKIARMEWERQSSYEDKDLILEEYHDMMKKGIRKHEKAVRLLFKILERNAERWWV